MEVLAEKLMENAEPITNVNGTPVVSFEEQRDMNVEILRAHAKLQPRKYNADGTVSRSKVTSAAINMGAFFDNRYKKVKDKLYVVSAQTTDGYRAIQDQATGRMSDKYIPAWVFGRDKDGNLEYIETVQIKDEEFLANFTRPLNEEVMYQLIKLLENKDTTVTKDDLPI